MKSYLFAAVMALALIVNALPQDQVHGRVFWKGKIDDKVQLTIHGDKIETKTLSGTAYPDGTYSFTSPLPSSPVKVGVNKTEGRGYVAVTQQPSEDNGFIAIITITDPKGGAKEYQLEIFWQ